ncbi:winged helix DNA-binding domain-containing protein [Streptomyces capparidis]
MASKSASGAEVLGERALGRALLARQMLVERQRLSARAALEHLVGMQAQAPSPPYTGLWTRLVDFRAEELSTLIAERRAVRIVLMRGTIHLVTAADALAIRPWVQPMLDRALRGGFGRALADLDHAELAALARELVEKEPLTYRRLGELLRERWPDRDPADLGNAARCLLPLVQVPPRGLWGRSGPAAHTTAESWLGRPLQEQARPEELVLRYLAAFGPATARDAQAWCGLTRLREVLDRLRPRLLTFRGEDGRELFDLPDAPRPDPDTPVPPRFLPPFDNLLLSHADRGRVISDRGRARLFTKNAVFPGTVLVDGMAAGTWGVVRERGTAVLAVRMWEPAAPTALEGLASEGDLLLRFLAEDADTREVRFADPGGTGR